MELIILNKMKIGGIITAKDSLTVRTGLVYISLIIIQWIIHFLPYDYGTWDPLHSHFVRLMMNRDRFSLKFFSFFAIFFIATSTLGALSMQSGVATFTRREIFSLGPVILLSIFIIISFGYFIFNRRVTTVHRKSFFYFYLGLFLVTAMMVIPLHILGIRFIEVYQEGTYVYASFFEQIAVMYGYSLAIEAAGFFLPYYVLIYHFKLIELK